MCCCLLTETSASSLSYTWSKNSDTVSVTVQKYTTIFFFFESSRFPVTSLSWAEVLKYVCHVFLLISKISGIICQQSMPSNVSFLI